MWAEWPWRGEVWGESKWATMVCSGSLAPCSVTPEIICSTVHAHHEVLAWSQIVCIITCVSSTSHMWCVWVVALLLLHGSVHWVSHERRDYNVSSTMAAVSARREYCSGCCVSQERSCVVLGYAMADVILSQERINMSVVPMAPRISFQLLSSCLVYTGISKQCRQCEQQDNWCHGQDEEQYR